MFAKPHYDIVSLKTLVPLEQVFTHHLENLSNKIKQSNVMFKPIIADINTGLVLDGSNRYAFLLKEGYLEAPVFWCDYHDNKISTGITLTKSILSEIAVEKSLLLPPRTTRHKFPFLKDDYPTDLLTLKRGEKSSIKHLLYDSTREEEIAHNVEFIRELDDTKVYLQNQLNLLKPKGIFVGKFNPPHMGHAATILKLKEDWDLTICITNDDFNEYPFKQNEIVEAMKIFGVPVNTLHKKLVSLDFNVWADEYTILSGNPEVIKWCEKHDAKHRFIERTGSISGTVIRDFYKFGD